MKQYIKVNDNIIETKTSNTIYSGHDCKKLYRHLNGGGGFNGFTPDFFLNRIRAKN